MRVLMTWDVDNTNIDMHVIEPSKEDISVFSRISSKGGYLSHSSTGYGPEGYLHKKAVKGHYTVKAQYRSSLQRRLLGPATVTVIMYQNWGRKNQTRQTTTVRLDGISDSVIVGEYDFK